MSHKQLIHPVYLNQRDFIPSLKERLKILNICPYLQSILHWDNNGELMIDSSTKELPQIKALMYSKDWYNLVQERSKT